MTSTKWFALGSFGLSTVLAYVGGFAGSAFVERQITTDSAPPEIIATENRTSTQNGPSSQLLVDVPQMKENTFKALSTEVSLILHKQAQKSAVP